MFLSSLSAVLLQCLWSGMSWSLYPMPLVLCQGRQRKDRDMLVGKQQEILMAKSAQIKLSKEIFQLELSEE